MKIILDVIMILIFLVGVPFCAFAIGYSRGITKGKSDADKEYRDYLGL